MKMKKIWKFWEIKIVNKNLLKKIKKIKRDLVFDFNNIVKIIDNPSKINEKFQLQQDILKKIYNIYYPFVK